MKLLKLFICLAIGGIVGKVVGDELVARQVENERAEKAVRRARAIEEAKHTLQKAERMAAAERPSAPVISLEEYRAKYYKILN